MQSSRLEETKRPLKSSSNERYSEPSRKRGNSGQRFEPPPAPSFDFSIFERQTDKKRDDYSSSKRGDYNKRDINVSRHSSSYHGSRTESSGSHKSNRYSETEHSNRPEPRPPSFRRTDERSDPSKRYGEISSYTERQSASTCGSQWHNHNAGPPIIKSFTSNTMQPNSNVPSWQTKSSEDHWRPVDAPQDRYDRTYNERVGPYMEAPRQPGMFMGRQDRYGAQISRYENGKY